MTLAVRLWRTAKARWPVLAAVAGCLFACALLVWSYAYLRPDTWRYHTDETGLRRLARDGHPRYVLWDDPASATGPGIETDGIAQPALSPDGATLVYARMAAGAEHSDLFRCRWDGRMGE